MSYATVMVSLALDRANEASLEAAGQIAERFDAGIIGIAAYGHSRFRELVLGGMTQHLIAQTARCVLLSH
jgi:nucleotide-binding universal stress UspA family protein